MYCKQVKYMAQLNEEKCITGHSTDVFRTLELALQPIKIKVQTYHVRYTFSTLLTFMFGTVLKIFTISTQNL